MTMIAIVGGDGAGKTSTVRRLHAELARDLRVTLIDKWDVLDSTRYPEYRFLRPELPTLRGCISDMQEVTRTLFVFWTLHGTLTPKAMEGADVVLLDGYWPKHAASEILYSGRRDLVGCISALMPRPDVTLFLDVDPEVAYRRRAGDATTPLVPYECGRDPSRSEASFVRHQAATRAILRDWCSVFGWTRIDANVDTAAVMDAVREEARGRLARSRTPEPEPEDDDGDCADPGSAAR